MQTEKRLRMVCFSSCVGRRRGAQHPTAGHAHPAPRARALCARGMHALQGWRRAHLLGLGLVQLDALLAAQRNRLRHAAASRRELGD
eukprot:3085724-Prymnesium_polylepis.1